MKTIIRNGLFVCFMTLLLQEVFSQATIANNLPGANRFLGFDGPQNLEFRTNNLTRMQQMETGTSTINGFSIARGGFLGLSQDPTFFTAGAASPFSLLHLNGDNASGLPQELGFRDWMRYGLTSTHNQDLMYVGQRRVGATDVTDAVIAWADNTPGSSFGPDNLTFLFTSGTATDLECARMTAEGHTGIGTSWNNTFQPKRTLDVIRQDAQPQFRITRTRNANVNLGVNADFQVSSLGNLHIKPKNGTNSRTVAIGFLESELPDPITTIGARLDVGGITRIRNTPVPEVAHCLIVGNNVLGNQADNVLTRLDFPNDPTLVLSGDATWVNVSALDCRWVDITSSTVAGELDIASGFNTTSNCYRGKLAFGAANSFQSKVYVKNLQVRDRVLTGLYANTETFDAENIEAIGVLGESESGSVSGSVLINIGVKGLGRDSRTVVGVLGVGRGIVTWTGNTFGVRGEASGGQNFNFGVYGQAPGGFAVYSAGTPASTGPLVSLSDASVKTNVANIQNGLEKIGQLQPKTYTYIQEGNESMNFKDGLHYGFLAQDVQAVLPDVVMPFVHPAQYDTLGNEISPNRELLGIKYGDIVPILVQAVKEANGIVTEQGALIQSQNEQIQALLEQNSTQQQQLNDLQQQMAYMNTAVLAMQAKTNNCCNDGSTGSLQAPASKNDGVKLMQNVPNPFDSHTRIDFTLPADAYVVLELSDAQGRPLRRLVDGQMNAGPQTITLDGSSLAPGMYYYTVYANGELLTKKMVKK